MRIIKENKKKLNESSFLVGEKTFGDILSLFRYSKEGDRKLAQLSPAKEAAQKYNGDYHVYGDAYEALYSLNALALAGRYGDDYNEIMNKKGSVPYTDSSFVQKYKSLQAFLYQCYEEPADKEPLFKYLWGIKEEMKKAVGLYIEETPEYDKCYWGD